MTSGVPTADSQPRMGSWAPPGPRPLIATRDAARRDLYARAALASVPRLLGAIDRNPFSPTYGCFDREFWHYRTASFPCGMHQEGVLPLALVFVKEFPGNRWQGVERVKELAIAGLRFAARSAHPDGSCDDYYPFERALGAAVFTLQAAARAVELLRVRDAETLEFLRRRARWIARHDESGTLTNHHALAALGLERVARLCGEEEFRAAARRKLAQVLACQCDEGWFDEYGGADPGYQTLTIDCLASLRRLTGNAALDEPLARAIDFARKFLHPDDSYGGEYGSRGTFHCFPHGLELLAGQSPAAADLADGFLRGLAAGKQAAPDDDRLYIHRVANLLEAYLDWSPHRPAAQPGQLLPSMEYLPAARILLRRNKRQHTLISAARGGVFKHFHADADPVTDAGLVLETSTGRLAVSQCHDLSRPVLLEGECLTVGGPLYWVRHETATPCKQAAFHLGLWLVGRWCRTLVRRLLQRRLITGRRPCPATMVRSFEFLPGKDETEPRLRVTDRIELHDPRLRVKRLAFGTDHESAYVAASGVYQDAVLAPWMDLTHHVETLNRKRSLTIVRVF